MYNQIDGLVYIILIKFSPRLTQVKKKCNKQSKNETKQKLNKKPQKNKQQKNEQKKTTLCQIKKKKRNKRRETKKISFVKIFTKTHH